MPPEKPTERYALMGRLGAGGMATVFVAVDRQLDRTVAVKCLHPDLAERAEMRARFLDEARILATLDHPGSVPVHELGALADGEPFYAMKRVRGRTLRELLQERTPAQVRSRHGMMHLLDVFERICQTMAAAHARSIIHRDLKPDNVMVDDFGAVYVMDWGLAKRLRPAGEEGAVERTSDGTVLGTPAYMSPEQVDGRPRETEYRSDVFSLGVILYEILCGRNPFRGKSDAQSDERVLHHQPRDPRRWNRHLPRAISAVCMKAIDKDPQRRYPSARELAEDVRRFMEFLPVSAVRPRLVDRVYNAARRRPVPAAVVATLLFAAIVAAAAVAFEISVERRQLAEGYALMDERFSVIARIDAQLQSVRAVLRADGLGEERRAELVRERAELETRRAIEEDTLRGIAWAITGFTLFFPEQRARAFLLRNEKERIERAEQAGDWVRAESGIKFLLGVYNRKNVLHITEEEAAALWSRLERIRAARGGPAP